MKIKAMFAALGAMAMLPSAVWAEAGHSGYAHHEAFSAGEPGDAKKPARIVQVTMGEADGKMMFSPARLDVKKGEQVKFVLRNDGLLEHEFVLASTADNLKHVEEMKTNPDMEHDEPNGKTLAAKNAGEFVWRFTKAGEFEYACLIPGHREAGMIGIVVVK